MGVKLVETAVKKEIAGHGPDVVRTSSRIRSRLQDLRLVVFRNVEAGPQKTGAGDLALLAPYGQGTLAPAPGIAPRLTNRTNGLRN